MFSPETFAVVSSLIKKLGESVSELNTTMSTHYWAGKNASSIIANQQKTEIDASFTAADEYSIYSGATNKQNGLAWIGFKATASLPSFALLFRGTSADMYIGIGYRNTSGTWKTGRFVL